MRIFLAAALCLAVSAQAGASAEGAATEGAGPKFPLLVTEADANKLVMYLNEVPMKFGLPVLQWMQSLGRAPAKAQEVPPPPAAAPAPNPPSPLSTTPPLPAPLSGPPPLNPAANLQAEPN